MRCYVIRFVLELNNIINDAIKQFSLLTKQLFVAGSCHIVSMFLDPLYSLYNFPMQTCA